MDVSTTLVMGLHVTAYSTLLAYIKMRVPTLNETFADECVSVRIN
jgi:hypothetical protein